MRKVSCRYAGYFLSLIFLHLASGSPYSKPDVQLFIMWYRGVKIIRNLSSVDYLLHRTPGAPPAIFTPSRGPRKSPGAVPPATPRPGHSPGAGGGAVSAGTREAGLVISTE